MAKTTKCNKLEQMLHNKQETKENNIDSHVKTKSLNQKVCKEKFDKSSQVPKSFKYKPSTKPEKNRNLDGNKSITKAQENAIERSVSLSSPGLCSSLQLASEIESVLKESQRTKLMMPLDTEEQYKQKVVRKANVPFSKQIFRHLVDLHIEKEDLVLGSVGRAKSTSFGKKSDDSFHLSNFYKPDFSTQYYVHIKSCKVDIEKVQFYNGVNSYNHLTQCNDIK